MQAFLLLSLSFFCFIFYLHNLLFAKKKKKLNGHELIEIVVLLESS